MLLIKRYLIFSTLHKIKFIEKVAEDPRLKGGEARVAILLICYANTKTGRCFPAQETIANRLNLSVRQVNHLIGKLVKVKHIKRLKKGNKGAGSNEYDLQFAYFNDDADIRKYSSNKQEVLKSKYRKYTSYETRKETSYETVVKEKNSLEEYVSFVKRSHHIPSISDDMVEEMLRRQLITKEEYKKW